MISDTTGHDGEIEHYYSKCLVDRIWAFELKERLILTENGKK